MSENTVKIDPATDRMVADLAHFLGRTKKTEVRDAVSAFAELHGHSITSGIAHSSDRIAAASGSVERERLLAEAGGDVRSLSLRDRVKVQRVELVALLERHGGRNPRIVGELAGGGDAESLELLVESDPYAFDFNPAEATITSQQLLGAPVTLYDATRLRLFSPDRLDVLEREAIPL